MINLKRVLHHLIWVLKGIQVFTLIGKSGTGKSFRAQLISQKYGIELIIDDGLIIRDQKILAGKSAKKEKIRLTATKTALFMDPSHAQEVRNVLKTEHFKRILLIGTSSRMVKRITQTLDLPSPHKIINIDDVATEDEIETARRARNDEGKHIIPVPSVEVKRNYPHIFFETVKIFFRRSLRLTRNRNVFEKTVVRPEYSKRGKVTISENSLSQMVVHCINEFDTSLKVEKIIVKEDRYRYNLEVILDIPYGTQIAGAIHKLQRYILENIERFTGLILEEVNITIGRVSESKKAYL